MTRMTRLKQIAAGTLAVLSLCVASVGACMCTHHQKSPEPQRSCHDTTPEPHHGTPEAGATPSVTDGCTCFRSTTRLSIKSEGFKFKKHPANVSLAEAVAPVRFGSAVPSLDPILAPAFPQGRFCPATSSRGPPLS